MVSDPDEHRKDLGHAHPLELIFEFMALWIFLMPLILVVLSIPAAALTVLTLWGLDRQSESIIEGDVLPITIGYWAACLIAWLVFSKDGREVIADVVRLFRRLSASWRVRRQRRDATREQIARRAEESGARATKRLSEQAGRVDDASRQISRIHLEILVVLLGLLVLLVGLILVVLGTQGDTRIVSASAGGLTLFVMTVGALQRLSTRSSELSKLQHERYEAQQAAEALVERGQAQAGSLSIAGDGVEGRLSVVDEPSDAGVEPH